MQFLHRLLVLSCLFWGMLMYPLTAQAGHYTVQYSGGISSTSQSSYNYEPFIDGYGNINYQGGATDYSYSPASLAWASGSGTITATFTWVPDYTGDDPPKSAIIHQISSVYASSFMNSDGAAGTVTAADGLGDPATTYSSSTMVIVTSNGDLFTVQNNPGASFSISCSPSMDCEVYSGFCDGLVVYSATATPVVVQLYGPTRDTDNSQNILIGQGVVPTLTIGDWNQNVMGSFSNWSWTITGDPFKNFEIASDQSYGHAIELTATDKHQASFTYFYRSIPSDPGPSPSTVTCSATYVDPKGTAHSVTAQATVKVYKPAHEFRAVAGTVQNLNSPSFGNGATKLSGRYLIAYDTSDDYGITWRGSATTPALFTSSSFSNYFFPNGTWCVAQIITADITTTPYGGTPTTHHAGAGLDAQFPYDLVFPGDGTSGVDGDSPGIGLVSSQYIFVNLSYVFNTFMLYMPPDSGTGTTYVPLHEMDWYMKAAAQYGMNGWEASGAWVSPPLLWDGTSYGTIQITNSAPTSVLPDWTLIVGH